MSMFNIRLELEFVATEETTPQTALAELQRVLQLSNQVFFLSRLNMAPVTSPTPYEVEYVPKVHKRLLDSKPRKAICKTGAKSVRIIDDDKLVTCKLCLDIMQEEQLQAAAAKEPVAP